jgi:hypothetical protein
MLFARSQLYIRVVQIHKYEFGLHFRLDESSGTSKTRRVCVYFDIHVFGSNSISHWGRQYRKSTVITCLITRLRSIVDHEGDTCGTKGFNVQTATKNEKWLRICINPKSFVKLETCLAPGQL